MAPWIGRYLTNPVVFEDPLPELLPLCLFGGFGVLGGLTSVITETTLSLSLSAPGDFPPLIRENNTRL